MKTAPANVLCRHCGAALDALACRRGAEICGAAKCRHQADQARAASIRQALATAAPAAARRQLPHLREPPAEIVWLKHCDSQMIPVDDDDREQHRAYLESVVAGDTAVSHPWPAPSTASDKHPHGPRLCGQCRGRCCVEGASSHAFIELTVLQRWQQEHPERSLADAIDAYLSMLPPEHVRGACLYQTATGCAMPRERRADICNGFECDALEQVRRAAEAAPAAAVLAITFHIDYVERAAVIEADATHALELETPAAPYARR